MLPVNSLWIGDETSGWYDLGKGDVEGELLCCVKQWESGPWTIVLHCLTSLLILEEESELSKSILFAFSRTLRSVVLFFGLGLMKSLQDEVSW